MSKNIVKIILERKMNIEENIVNNIMDYHGDIDKMLPEGNFPENIKRCMRMGNWKLTEDSRSGRGGSYIDYFIEININENNLQCAFKNNVNVTYEYPVKCSRYSEGIRWTSGEKRIINIENDLIRFGKNKLKLNRFGYLQIKHVYKQIDIFQH